MSEGFCGINSGITWAQAYCAGLDAARKKIMGLPYEIDGEIWVDRDEVIGWIDKLLEDK